MNRSRLMMAAALAAVVVATGAGCGAPESEPRWVAATVEPSEAAPSTAPSPSATAEPAGGAISLSATGDIVMGRPGAYPANDGKGFFDKVKSLLPADLVMGNLEEPITDDTGTRKCAPTSTKCHQFRVPPHYAKYLSDAGFMLMNQANNHGNDFGSKGYSNTQKALEEVGLKHTGAPDQITVVDVKGVKVAVVGFSSYAWNNSLTNITSAKKVVEKAAEKADIVVVQVHMGAEGSGMTHVKPGTEMFLGENRGDPIKFSHAMIDAGADLIVGHGPHVLRGMEFYKGRLIAYSLGNFAGGGRSLTPDGRLGWGGVLKVTLKADGSWVSGDFLSSIMNSAGIPTVDSNKKGAGAVSDLTKADFPKTGPKIDKSTGKITPADA
ncbi:poly-gamma-glutamate capsule biosynthesis protein CapA/YwtB (metallophosphatase superfamily) [Allocatelliglobosispora scoriae]|uniref:Poly-gamma-glutamate capsule biosynthesis protein CapA/YwtB (Metallophosphatase superfamily) n=1 Tax=Allocatelliglobosispora scoriae TaxID=643052 RepID=A0A841BQ83_9ACTN|nr:CapA family protein [Allocatelliglobosispora scoriae]MBB5871227.1 poly-gamma-glutamate capsule biosynthesis protein CapA/YwtB (metallophosphatase superfamily) [Allocatelliglobosispora scoriae]